MASLTKPTNPINPKDAMGIKRVSLHVVPQQVLAEVGLALMEGQRKYGSYNWRVAGVRGSVYFDAIWRHLASWWEGQDIDPASGIHHISKAIAGLMVLRDSMLMGNYNDDRPPNVIDQAWMEDANKKVVALIEKYPEPKEPNTQAQIDRERVMSPFGHDLTALRAYAETTQAVVQAKNIFTPYMASGPTNSVVQDVDGTVREYDASGLCVREHTPYPKDKAGALQECEQRYGVAFSDK